MSNDKIARPGTFLLADPMGHIGGCDNNAPHPRCRSRQSIHRSASRQARGSSSTRTSA